MIYTSETVQGQVYFPVVNYLRKLTLPSLREGPGSHDSLLVMIGTIIMVAVFKDLGKLTNAYGFAVSTVMFVTTSLVALQAYYTRHLPLVVAVGFFLVSLYSNRSRNHAICLPKPTASQIFGFFDGLYYVCGARDLRTTS